MATMQTFSQGKLIGPDEWNAHANQINTNTDGLAAGNTRITTLETNQGTRGSYGTVYGEVANLKSADTTLGNRVTTLEGQARGGAYYGTWSDAGGNTGGQTITNGTGGGESGIKVTDIGTVVETPVGCSFSAGTFTATQPGKWLFTVTTQYVGGNNAQRAVYLAKSNAASAPAGTKYGLNGGPSLDSQATTCRITLTANQQVSVYVACWTTGASVQIWKSQGCTFTATWLGP